MGIFNLQVILMLKHDLAPMTDTQINAVGETLAKIFPLTRHLHGCS